MDALSTLGAVAATAQLLEAAIRILRRLRKAHERQKTLAETLGRHECQLQSMKAIIGIIEDEETLQTATVHSEVLRMNDVEDKLVRLLRELDNRSRGAVTQFTHQLIHGSSEEKRLANIMDELCHVKSDLLLRIQVASVGVMRTVENKLVANAEAIERIDRFLKDELGERVGLRIAGLVKGRRPSNDGTVPLTHAELASLNGEDKSGDKSDDGTLVQDTDSVASVSNANAKTERIIIGNMTKDQALMICGPIGEDLWAHIGRLEIKNCKAENNSIQVNYATSREDFHALLDRQARNIQLEAGRWAKRHDSFN